MPNEHELWFEDFRQTKPYTLLQQKPLAYFSIEYALSDKLPTYAGGLGILAGDCIKELADRHIPAVAVGLYYQSRYGFDPHHTKDIEHILPTPENQGLKPVYDSEQKPLIVSVPIGDHDVFAKVWVWRNQSIPLYLLDTNVAENSQEDQAICYKLYDSDKEVRVKQEIILGIGGFRVLEALQIKPSLYHMNEGHSAFLVLEIIRHEMQKRKISFEEATKLASHHVVFTNHTLVPAGNDIFGNELLHMMLGKYASQLEIPVTKITDLGTIKDSHDFYLAVFAMRLAGKINGVSQLHVKEANKLWPDFTWEPVTNGIHLPSWDKCHGISATDDQNDSVSLQSKHKEHKTGLLQYIHKETGQQWREDALLIGWARRMVQYKRPLALFGELERFVSLASSIDRPIHVVMAGISHQADDAGREMIQKLQDMLQNELKGHVVYLSDYNKTLAQLLISGCDVWLNTPVVGSEACGTSGMKASLNGVLTLSTKDGWLDEVDMSAIGWTVESDAIQTSLLDTLEQKVLPTYYAEDHSGWATLQDNGRVLIQNQFSATRMLRDYFEKMYLPVITNSYEHYEV